MINDLLAPEAANPLGYKLGDSFGRKTVPMVREAKQECEDDRFLPWITV